MSILILKATNCEHSRALEAFLSNKEVSFTQTALDGVPVGPSYTNGHSMVFVFPGFFPPRISVGSLTEAQRAVTIVVTSNFSLYSEYYAAGVRAVVPPNEVKQIDLWEGLLRCQFEPLTPPLQLTTGIELQLDPWRQHMLLSGKRITVGKRPFRILHTLCENPNQITSHETIKQRAWGLPNVTNHALSMHVSRLRQLVGTEAITARVFEGYRLNTID